MNGDLNITALYEEHLAMNAAMDETGGWQMPFCYQEAAQEAAAVKAGAGVIDRGNSCAFRFYGKGADKALDGRFALPVADMKPGECRRNFLPDLKGCAAEIFSVCCMAPCDYLLLTGDSNSKAAANALTGALTKFLKTEDLSDYLTRLEFAGNNAVAILQKAGIDVPQPGECRTVSFGKELRGIACRLTDCGLDGIMLVINEDHAVAFWRYLAGLEGVVPCGVLSAEQLRVTSGMPSFPDDLNGETPLAYAGIPGLMQPLTRKFFGRPALEKILPDKRLVLLNISRPDAELANGTITSAAPCPEQDGTFTAIAYLPLKENNPQCNTGTVKLLRDIYSSPALK